MSDLQSYLDKHYIHKSNWLRASVLGANDAIISVASVGIGVASANASRESILLAMVASLVAGALSMAAGEYVSVSSQTDLERADIEREKQELIDTPEEELNLLAHIYEQRGLSAETAKQVALELTQHDALGAHVRDELGITEASQSNPIQAAMASGLSFLCGGIIPLIVMLLAPLKQTEIFLYLASIVSLILLGFVSAYAGGAKPLRAIIRITIWGTVAMGITALVGHLFGVHV